MSLAALHITMENISSICIMLTDGILYKKEYDPSAEILFDYPYIKSVAADNDESPTLFQISEK